MKREIRVTDAKGNYVTRSVQVIPGRYILALLITLIEVVAIMAMFFLCAIYIPYFYIAIYATVIGVIISIVASNDNPDYKVPWILCVLCIPIVGFMLYFLFYKRKLDKKYIRRLKKVNDTLNIDDSDLFYELREEDKHMYSQAICLKNISNTHLYRNTKVEYFALGEDMHQSMIKELEKAEKFIFLEYFIVEEGLFWNSILDVLKNKASQGVEVKVIYDDIGCLTLLEGNYYKKLKEYNIDCVPFARLKGQADNEFNNRSHRKIMVIDGKVGFTGGVNIADEYINKKMVYGHWKDTGIKLEGSAVNELTKLFLMDYYLNAKEEMEFDKYHLDYKVNSNSYIIPFGDGPKPIYDKNVGKSVIMNMLNQAKEYVYITTPYLIIDNELMQTIANTALRGVDVRIIVPHIPDKKLVFEMTKNNYRTLIKSNVKIYEYEPGFIHAKSYLADGNVAMIGTINLDYRSLTHHFENGVWIYNDDVIKKMKDDFVETMDKSIYMNDIKVKDNLINKFIRSMVKIFSPLL